MQVDAIALALRPRPMAEAADLGLLLVRRHARSIWACFLPVLALATALALATSTFGTWAPGLALFWLKPWLDRTLLFVLSRAVFGHETAPSDVWQRWPTVLLGRLPSTLTVRRLSPWRSYTAPAEQLEGQRGGALRRRRDQLLRGKRGAALGMQFTFAQIELACWASLAMLVLWLTPQGASFSLMEWARTLDPFVGTFAATFVYAAIVALVEPFYVAAGFCMYLNRRVELEAWDIEQEFRRAFI